jgi:allantoinase
MTVRIFFPRDDMPDFDLLIRNAANVPAIGVVDGKIAALAEGSAREEIDASGLLVLPGAIDAHVHFNEPGRADWEGIATGSRACAAGGTTTYFDMPLNSTPPVCDAVSFQAKRAVAERESFVDFALWGGLIPGKIDQIEALRDCGAIGLKAFMSHSGIDDFPKADATALKAGMKQAAALGMLVAVHAEIDHPELRRGSSVRDYLASRPISMETEAVRLALELAGETGCALHVVHVSSAEGARLIAQAARAGTVNVTSETCPHYLTLTGDDMERLGAVAKCAPPLRDEAGRRALLDCVRSGCIDTIGSDHSPSPMTMKTDPDFFKVWGGVSGCQHLLALLFDLGLDPELISRLTASAPASRFRIANKGRLSVDAEADFVLFDPTRETHVTPESLHYRHKHSPYVGCTLRGKIVRTFLRGRTIWNDGQLMGGPTGRLISPQPHSR